VRPAAPGVAKRRRYAAVASTVSAAAAALLAATATTAVLPGRARADIIYEMAPAVAVGVTDNSLATSTGAPRQADDFANASLNVRGRYTARTSSHGLGLRLSYTQFFGPESVDTVSGEAGWSSAFTLSALLELRVSAGATLSRTSRIDPGDLVNNVPQGAVGGTNLYLRSGASQQLTYQPTPRRRYIEALSFENLHYLRTSGVVIPDTTNVSLRLVGEWAPFARDTFTLSAQIADSYRARNPLLPEQDFSQGHTFLTYLLAGWRRELSVAWSSDLQAGPLMIFKLNGTAVIAPAAVASINYRSVPWFATLTLSQLPIPNLFLGEATITDQALVRLALPLTARELVLVAGYAGLSYARIANRDSSVTRAYDQRTAGLSINARLPNLPFWASLSYYIVDQDGSNAAGRMIPDLVRQTLFIGVGGTFQYGPGAPPNFGGVL
jgi:hypothetical protein